MRETSISHENFLENYEKVLRTQNLLLIYTRQSYDSVSDTGLHLHTDHYALYLVQSGRGIHHINGHPYAVARGDVYLTGPGTIHAYYDGENLEVDSFVFPIELLNEEEIAALRGLPGFRGLFATGEAWNSHRLHLTPERWSHFEGTTRQVCDDLERGHEEYALERRADLEGTSPSHLTISEILARDLFFRLLVELARCWGEATSVAAQVAEAVTYRTVELAEVLRFCEAHFSDPISVPQLAAKMFLSPSRFGEIFKRETGVPPAKYLHRLRLDRAQALLKTSKEPATDIALRCGFSDAAQFSRAFRAAFGIAPTEYRRRFSK
jgi:AraC-like DNA-binding protein/quercetin dioxygenase-like cupin family protein